MSWLNLASWIPCTEVEGPGKRAALWVQGCDKRCVGCCNPDYLKIVEREILKAEAMVDRLLEAQAAWGLEGVTFLGENHSFKRKVSQWWRKAYRVLACRS